MAKDETVSEKKIINIFVLIFLILALACSGFLIYEIFLLSSIETVLRYIVIGILGFLDLIFILKTRKYFKGKSKKGKKYRRGLFIFVLLIYSIICFACGGVIFYLYDKISSMNKGYITYTSNMLVLSSNEANNIDDIKDMTIGILNDNKSAEGYIIPQEIIKENKLNDENEIKKYEDYTSMMADLYAEEIDAIFTSGSYVSMFSGISGYENVESDTKVIISKDKKMRKSETSSIETASSGKSIKEPFTILLMGIDSTDEVLSKNAVANGDTLILITFNPKTLNATMISIPRDSYIPIACWSGKPENKITHAAAYGNDCMINSIQDYFDVTIDYYAKINFKGLVKLVDAVGGVDVEVPQVLCTDDSSREEEICIQPGEQTLNGEQALVFARNRKQLANGDFGRAQHQQEIIMALINKMKTIKDVSTFMDILNTISNSLDTNLTTKQILSFYNVGKDIVKKSLASDDTDLINIQQLYLQGEGQMIYDERARMVLWDYVPNRSSRKDIVKAMKINLELAKHSVIKEFSFSINKPYEKEIIGEGPYKNNFTYTLLPDFRGDSESTARAYASKHGISVTFRGTGGTVVAQNYPANKRVDLIKGSVVLTLSGGSVKGGSSEDKLTTKKDNVDSNDKKDNNKSDTITSGESDKDVDKNNGSEDNETPPASGGENDTEESKEPTE